MVGFNFLQGQRPGTSNSPKEGSPERAWHKMSFRTMPEAVYYALSGLIVLRHLCQVVLRLEKRKCRFRIFIMTQSDRSELYFIPAKLFPGLNREPGTK